LADLINANEFVVLNNQYFCKPPNYKMTSAHQDNAYFETNDNVFTFWIPLQDVDVINSCMFYVPKSNLQGLLPHKVIGTNVRTRTGKTGYSLYSDYYKNNQFVKVPMTKGQVLVHDKNTMHFSSPNLSDEYRIAITCIIKVISWK
jgi:ectoine hydroxylase-related dioxygenase (phytanoyl-CoA dioxygenase family)